MDMAFDLDLALGTGIGTDRSSGRAPAPSLLTPSLLGSELRHRHSFSCSLVRLLCTVLLRERLSKFFGQTMKLNQRGTSILVLYSIRSVLYPHGELDSPLHLVSGGLHLIATITILL